MKILLTVFGVYDTLENVDDVMFKEIINKIKQVKEINNDDVILISFCDNTENKDIIMYYLRNITDDEILIGRQFLNNVYYNDIVKSGALLYDKKINKEQKVFDYTAKLIENNNIVDLYYIDKTINEQYINDLFSVFGDKVNTNIIKNNDTDIIQKLDKKIYNDKMMKLKI